MSAFRSARIAAVVVFSTSVLAAAPSAGQEAPPMPKPGPEHEVFKMDVGTWDAIVEVTPAPGAPPMKSTGVEVNTIGCGGLCVITDFKGEAMGAPFHGHGVMAWDPAKKKYVGSWTDSMSTGLAVAESTWDPAAKKWTGWMEAPDMTGKVMKMRSVVEWRDASTRVFTMYSPGPDGKEMEGMKITYTRRK
jgi:hypothetical protein